MANQNDNQTSVTNLSQHSTQSNQTITNPNVEYTSNTEQHLKRSLKARHMNMIALGGAIGTGLFVAGGEVVSTAGPGGALVAYCLIGIMVYFLFYLCFSV